MMADPRFFSVAGPFSAGELADRAGAEVDGDSARMISGAAPLETASADDLSFFDNPKFRQAFASRPGRGGGGSSKGPWLGAARHGAVDQ